jgi:hypothetical protein
MNMPRELQSMIDGIRERLPGIRYRVDSLHRYQADTNKSRIITLPWNVAVPGQGTKTGTDLLRHEGARVTEVGFSDTSISPFSAAPIWSYYFNGYGVPSR